jgi:hypothetical protein
LNRPTRRLYIHFFGLKKQHWAATRKLIHAHILLKADQAPGGPGWTDERIMEAFNTSASTLRRARQAFVEDGLDLALNPKKPVGRQYRKLDGAQAARLIAVACSAAPEGRTQPGCLRRGGTKASLLSRDPK